jgi:hypothetical protein
MLFQYIFLHRKWRSNCHDHQLRHNECHCVHGGQLRLANANTEDANPEATKSESNQDAKPFAKSDGQSNTNTNTNKITK